MFMKKKSLVFVFALLLVLVGCGGKSSEEKINDEYEVFVKFDSNDNYYDEDGNCYDEEGDKKTCDRIITENFHPYITLKDQAFEVIYYVDEKGDLSLVRFYMDGSKGLTSSYNIWNKDDDGDVVLANEDTQKLCLYNFRETNGDDKKSSDIDKCKVGVAGDAKKIKEEVEKKLEEQELSTEDIVDYFEWFKKEKLGTIEKKVSKAFKKQKKLSIDEIEEKIKVADFEINKTDDTLTIDEVNMENRVAVTYEEDGKPGIIAYTHYLFSDEDSADSMKLGYDFKGKDFFAVNATAGKKLTCSYYLEDEQSVNGTKCTKAQIDKAKTVMSSFEYQLMKWKITFDEFVNFAENYK